MTRPINSVKVFFPILPFIFCPSENRSVGDAALELDGRGINTSPRNKRPLQAKGQKEEKSAAQICKCTTSTHNRTKSLFFEERWASTERGNFLWRKQLHVGRDRKGGEGCHHTHVPNLARNVPIFPVWSKNGSIQSP